MTEKWERCPRIEGSYVFDKEENLEPYFKATGDLDMMSHMKDYKMHICVKGKQICFSDFYGEVGIFSNCMDLDVEMAFRAPGDKKGKLKLLIIVPTENTKLCCNQQLKKISPV